MDTLLWTTLCGILAGSTAAVDPVVEVEEIVTRYAPANNGAGPLWCYGSTVIGRVGADVFLSVIETGKDVPLLCNTRWQLWHRSDAGSWKVVQQEQDYRQREPCPVGVFPSGAVFLSVNPSTEPPGTKYGPCKPLVLQFNADAAAEPFRTHEPAWPAETYFTDHSYRGFAADGHNNELLLLNIHARSGDQFVSYMDGKGTWHAKGSIHYPIRSCYPQVALRDRAAHVLAIGDIVEPNAEWRKLKFEKLNRQWDYVFRRLFYTYTPDIRTASFATPVEIDSVEETAGHITNLDLHVDKAGTAHVLYLKRPYQYAFLRDTYFPGQPMMVQLQHMQIKDGRVVGRRTLAETPPVGQDGLEPSYARYHVDSSERLWVVAAGTMKAEGQSAFGNFAAEVRATAARMQWRRLPMDHPFRSFMTATPRAGTDPSNTLDLFGTADDNPNLRYARLRTR